jgi:hypothetical protein
MCARFCTGAFVKDKLCVCVYVRLWLFFLFFEWAVKLCVCSPFLVYQRVVRICLCMCVCVCFGFLFHVFFFSTKETETFSVCLLVSSCFLY